MQHIRDFRNSLDEILLIYIEQMIEFFRLFFLVMLTVNCLMHTLQPYMHIHSLENFYLS